jgi:hypothetical protein
VRVRIPLSAALVLSVVLVGCGSSGDRTTPASTSSPAAGNKARAEAKAANLVPPPAPKESIGEAVNRIAAVIGLEDCPAVNHLTALSRPYDACAGLQGLVSLPVSGSASYGDAGGVIQYGSGGDLRNAILILDSDGRYHIPVVDPYNTTPSVKTEFAEQFDAAARTTVDAMRERDCDKFRTVALVRFGAGAAPVCTYLDDSPLTQLLAAYPKAKALPLGGNGNYAFYSVSGPDASYTLIFARESDSGVAAAAPPLPKDAPEFGFVDAYQTNPAVSGAAPPG